MKFMRRGLALLLCFLICLGSITGALAYTGVSSWAANEIASADELGLIPDSLKNANMSLDMTRQQMCELAVKSFEVLTKVSLYPSSTAHFSDTTNATINVAYELGIVNGYTDGTFKPSRKITREEFCKIVSNLFASLKWDAAQIQLDQFSDQNKISSWARPAAAVTVKLGIVNGNTNKTITPNDTTSSEQALVMTNRCYTFLRTFLKLDDDEGSGGDIGTVTGSIDSPAEPAAPAAPAQNYISSAWAQDTLQSMASADLIPDSLLSADLRKNVSREQMCEIALKAYNQLAGKPYVPKATNYFTDTTSAAVSAAYELKIVSGYPDKKFKPTAGLTREEFFQIMANLLAALGWKDTEAKDQLFKNFQDAGSVSDWALEPVILLHQLGILRGTTGGKVLPGNNISIQEAICLFMRSYNYINQWYARHPLDKIDGPLQANTIADAVVAKAMTYLGYPYVWAGASPSVGFDCSGFTYYVYKQFGYTLGRDAAQQSKNGVYVPRDSLQPGDLLIFSKAGDLSSIGHVAMYIGNGQMIHAQSTSTGVCITPLSWYDSRYITARRIIV